METRKILISYKTILAVVLIIIGLFLAYELRSLILIFFIAYIINAGLRPIVNSLTSRKVSRGVAILITYLLIFFVFGFCIAVILNTAIVQISEFINNLDFHIATLTRTINNNEFLSQYVDTTNLSRAAGDIASIGNLSPERIYNVLFNAVNVIGLQGINILGKFVSLLISFLLVVILSIYMIQNKRNVYEGVLEMFPSQYSKKLNPILTKIEHSLGSWLLGQAILMILIGLSSFIAIQLPRFFSPDYQTYKYALVIAIVAAIFEAVPNIGPTLTLLFALFMAILSGATLPILLFIIVAFIVIQQIEGLFLVPRIMNKAVDLNPVITILGVTAGFQLGGPVGALISVPLLGAAQIVIKELAQEWRKSTN